MRGGCDELFDEFCRSSDAKEEINLKFVHADPLQDVHCDTQSGAPQQLPDGTPVPCWRWGITKQQLADLHAKCKADKQWNDDDSIADFVNKFVKPMTNNSGMGTALYLNQDDPKTVNLMVSHAWQENA